MKSPITALDRNIAPSVALPLIASLNVSSDKPAAYGFTS
jgi:hypothetical protein